MRGQDWVRLLVMALVALLSIPGIVIACQQLPNIPCGALPSVAVSNGVDPFTVYVSFTNLATTAPFPPPFNDDASSGVSLFSDQGGPRPGACRTLSESCTIDPAQRSLRVDDAWSPYADEPSGATLEFVVTPDAPGASYGVGGSICVGAYPATCYRRCTIALCIPASPDPSSDPVPFVEFLAPAQAGAAGSAIPFDMIVHRNGYPAGRPLTVRVLPENFSDPIDLFPLTPPSLSTTGYDVLGDEEAVAFHCDTHYPCFVGVENVYHVTIHDGGTSLWDSRVTFPMGVAHARIDRSPLARQELVEILDDGRDGALSIGEHGIIHLRLFARNPYLMTSLAPVAMDMTIPAGLTVKSYSLHYHDNPMDSYTPTPAELEAFGGVAIYPDRLHVDIADLVARFTTPPFSAPTVFHDLFEVELYLETPAAGFPIAMDIVFPGLTVSGTASGMAKAETSGPLTIAVVSVLPPLPTGTLYAVKSGLDVRLEWADSPLDPSHDSATFYRPFRSVVSPPAMWAAMADVPDTLAAVETSRDVGALSPLPPNAALMFYRVSAFNAAGSSGDEPPTSRVLDPW